MRVLRVGIGPFFHLRQSSIEGYQLQLECGDHSVSAPDSWTLSCCIVVKVARLKMQPHLFLITQRDPSIDPFRPFPSVCLQFAKTGRRSSGSHNGGLATIEHRSLRKHEHAIPAEFAGRFMFAAAVK